VWEKDIDRARAHAVLNGARPPVEDEEVPVVLHVPSDTRPA